VILRELRLTYAATPAAIDRPYIKAPVDVVKLLTPILASEPIEVFGCLLLNAKGRVLCWAEVSRGGLLGTVVEPRDVFLRAVHGNAASIILAHNHPSGEATPSPNDIELTRRLRAAGELLGIDVLDHVILGGDQTGAWTSLRESQYWPLTSTAAAIAAKGR